MLVPQSSVISSAPLCTQKHSGEAGTALDGEDCPRTVVHEHRDILSRLKTSWWASSLVGVPNLVAYPPIEIAFGANTPPTGEALAIQI